MIAPARRKRWERWANPQAKSNVIKTSLPDTLGPGVYTVVGGLFERQMGTFPRAASRSVCATRQAEQAVHRTRGPVAPTHS